MMNINEDQAVYRVRKLFRKGGKPRKYQYTVEIVDERTQQVMAVCDVVQKAVFSTQTIADHKQKPWQMKPNRKVLPTRWILTEPTQHIAMQFDQKLLGKLANPIYKAVFSLLDGSDKEVYRLVDPSTSIPDRIMGINPGEWAIIDINGDMPVAKLGSLPTQKEQPKGLLGKLANMLTTSDRAIISAGSDHVLPAPVALGMFLLFKELTDASAG